MLQRGQRRAPLTRAKEEKHKERKRRVSASYSVLLSNGGYLLLTVTLVSGIPPANSLIQFLVGTEPTKKLSNELVGWVVERFWHCLAHPSCDLLVDWVELSGGPSMPDLLDWAYESEEHIR
ncbi:hypothetical protein QOT17_025304 [Balamuthia mandrillaris]